MRIGDKVRLKHPDEHQDHGATLGIYTLHNTDDYVMCGYVEIEDDLGRVFPVDAGLLEEV